MREEDNIEDLKFEGGEQFNLMKIELLSSRIILSIICFCYPMFMGLLMYFFSKHNNPFLFLLILTFYSFLILILSFVNEYVIRNIAVFLYSVCYLIIAHLIFLNISNFFNYEFSTPLLILIIVFSMFFKNLKQLSLYFSVVLFILFFAIRFSEDIHINPLVYTSMLVAGSMVSYFSLFTKLYAFESTIKFIKIKEREIERRRTVENNLLNSNEQLKIKNDSLYDLEEHLNRMNEEVIKLSEEIEEIKELNEEVFKFKTKFLKELNFEIRSRFNDITVGAHLLKKEGVKGKALDFAKLIDSSVNKLISEVSNLYEITLIQSDTFELASSAFEPNALFKRLKSFFDLQVANKQITFVFESSDTISGVMYDDTRVIQVLQYLLYNAITYTESGEVKVKISKIKKKEETESDQLLFEVIDTSLGVPEKLLTKLNKKLFYAKRDHIKDYSLDGDTITLCKYIVDRMNGEMGIESEFEVGSNFWFTCKVESLKGIDSSSELDENMTLSLDVLVVDDLMQHRQQISAILEENNCRVTFAEDGEGCLTQLVENEFDVVLLDIKLPDLSLNEVLEAVNILKNIPPLIALAPNVNQNAVDNYLQKGFKAVLRKPLEVDKMIEVLKQLKS